jgi:hypothetical protein
MWYPQAFLCLHLDATDVDDYKILVQNDASISMLLASFPDCMHVTILIFGHFKHNDSTLSCM